MEDLYYDKKDKKYTVTCEEKELMEIMEYLVINDECPHLRRLISRLLSKDYSALDEIYEPNYLKENKELYDEVVKYQDRIVTSETIRDKLYNAWELDYTLSKVMREEEKQPSFKYYERVRALIHLDKVQELELK